MVRPVTLFITTFVVSSLVVYWATASAFGQMLNTQQNGTRPHSASGNHCQIEIAGKLVRMQPGQGIETAGGWRNCQTYEDRTFLVFSTRPPKSVVMGYGS